MEILLTEKQIADGVADLALEINAHFRRMKIDPEGITVVGLTLGGVIFLADLIRRLDMPVRIGLVRLQSYRGTERGELKMNCSMLDTENITGKHVLLVDDIFDSGKTLDHMDREMKALGATSVASAVFLKKEIEHQVEYRPDFAVFEAPDAFIVGYGLDHDGHYRNLPYVALLE